MKLIAAANLIGDPDHITVGQVVYFPSFEQGGLSRPMPADSRP